MIFLILQAPPLEFLPGLQLPPQDEADTETGQGNDLRPLARVLAEVSYEIIHRLKLGAVPCLRFGFISEFAAIFHDDVSWSK